MSYNPETFFDNIGGSGAPSAKLSDVEDFVMGEVVDQFMAPAMEFGKDVQKKDAKTGEPIEQLVIVLQTDQRNWDGVARIPKVDKDDRSSADKPASDDDGRRALYVEPWTNIHAAIGAAVREANGKPGPVLNGATLGVKVTQLKDTGKGNPLKIHAAKYVAPAAPSASEEFFDKTAETPAADEPKAEPKQETAPAEPAKDPWGAPQPSGTSKAPF
jgi:hypothetical protein